ncbi:LCP family protein [Clostridium perfringens]|uniref:LCP family protein n=1 Tax=Clostridium perfringens TaxID=1502 RepID=UPI00103B30A9|nr:LCP family protein [Clostridium perfringens]MBO3378981.1 LCP family protein [Clostridium perfringens]MCX0362296.1 LCP family protein [Clostridium perfringens]TBX07792.1 LytR family transcriptional regulator [Clostridium perfringens]HAT4105166.1 LCP family protein [Clostridium perfringens]HAT4105558.1 LCP family protein [Clostridium perfringens]
MNRSIKNSKIKNSKIKYIILVLILVILGLIGVGTYYINSKINKVQKVEINKENLSINEKKVKEENHIKNIALFGIDAPKGKVGRSDAIMILTLDEEHKVMKLTSIMRDSYVDIPGHGDDKITHAYAFGGPELAMKTLNENFKVNVEDFMSVNFTSLPEIIDKLGGVKINIIPEEIHHIIGITSSGEQVLNGEQALAYSRIRYATGGDYKRTERQRVVLEAVFEKLKSTPIKEYPSLIDDFLPYIETNMSSMDMIKLATDAAPLVKGNLETARFPLDGYCDGKMINGVWYLVYDRQATLNQIQEYIYDNKNLDSFKKQ